MIKKRYFLGLLIIVWYLSIIPAQCMGTDSNKDLTILIIQSYNDEYSWTRDIRNGMGDALKNDFFKDYNLTIRIEYMDTKNYNQKDYLEDLKAVYDYKYSKMKVDYIFAADDAAFQFALEQRAELFSNAPIFFCGINSMSVYEIENAKNVYGIVETTSAEETLKVALNYNPDIRKIHILIDSTEIGVWTKNEIKKVIGDKYPNIELIMYENQSLVNIQSQIAAIESKNEIVLMGFFAVDADGKVYPVEKSTEMISKVAKIPVYGLWSFNFPYGIIGGKLISGYDQGRRTVELFQVYLQQKGIMDQRFIEYDESNRHMYDYRLLKQWGYDVEKLPKDSVIINMPENFYQKYKLAIWIFVGIFILGVLYIMALRYQVKMAKKRMENANERLIQSEKMASLGSLIRGMAHEMNTPLGNAVSLNSLMKQNLNEAKKKFTNNALSKTGLEQCFEQMDNASGLMELALIKTVGLMNAFKSIEGYVQSKEVESVNLNQFLTDLITAMQPSIRHPIQLMIAENISFRANPEHFYTIFYELIKNAEQHAYKKDEVGEISIKITREMDILNIQFVDHGKGILKEDRNRIFDPFFTTNWGSEHSGLGLFSVYNIVTLLEGTIELDNNYNQGTLFVIKIPIIL